MKWASLIVGLILFIPSATTFAIIKDIQNIPIIGQIMAGLFRVSPIIPLIIAIIGFVLIVNGFRTNPTKLTVKDAKELGLVRSSFQRGNSVRMPGTSAKGLISADTKYCKKCGAKNREENRFCYKCGQPFAQPNSRSSEEQTQKVLAICYECKNRIPSESKFCPECGANLQPVKKPK